MSIGQYAFTAESFLSVESVTTFHILLPYIQTWMALNSLKERDSLPLNLSLRLQAKQIWHCPWNWNNCRPNRSNWHFMCRSPTGAEHKQQIFLQLFNSWHIHISLLADVPRVNTRHFYSKEQELQISAVLSIREWLMLRSMKMIKQIQFLITAPAHFLLDIDLS